MIKFNKAFNLKTILFIAVLACIALGFICPGFALRVPLTEETKGRLNETLVKFMYGRGKIITLRNNVPELPRGQVIMDVLELGNLTGEQREIIAPRLERWLKEYSSIIGPSHFDTIRDIINYLKNPDTMPTSLSYKRIHVYFAISSPELNGTKFTEVEGLLVVVEDKDISVTNLWKIKPDNMDHRSKREKENGKLSKARFLGVGRQLLWSAIYSELERGAQSMIFGTAAPEELEDEGLRFDFPGYTRNELLELMAKRAQRTLTEHIENAPPEDTGAKTILEKLETFRKSPANTGN